MTDNGKEWIRRRRAQILVHSCLYYHLDDSIISDDQWQHWANELVQLQQEHGTKIKYYDRYFWDWDGTTGVHLPIKHPDIVRKAVQLLRIHEEIKYDFR